MAYASQSDECPPYPGHDPMNTGMHYKPQPSPSDQQAYFLSQSPSPPVVVIPPFGGYLGHSSQPMQCPTCRQQIISLVTYEPGGITWLIALLICFFGGIFGCCLIPFCVPECQDAIHICPACHAPLGRHAPF